MAGFSAASQDFAAMSSLSLPYHFSIDAACKSLNLPKVLSCSRERQRTHYGLISVLKKYLSQSVEAMAISSTKMKLVRHNTWFLTVLALLAASFGSSPQ